jgi:tetratricopeptide (TPR) repeat protein
MPWALAIVVVSAGMLAETAPPCPADRPVDEFIAEIQKQQSKKKHRNPNPLPDVSCIFGWCREHSKTPPTVPETAPQAQNPEKEDTNSGGATSSSSSSSTSSSRIPMDTCHTAMERSLAAAHNVEVGDYYFADKNYRAALLRYRDALEDKSADGAIHVRLGRVLEKLEQVPQAIEHYKAAQELGPPEKWAQEALAALKRLQPSS